MERKEKISLIEKAIADIRPAIQRDGGDIEFVSLNRGKVSVRLTGKCADCVMQKTTIDCVVLPFIMRVVPSVKKIEILA